jgi:hypothetical protein
LKIVGFRTGGDERTTRWAIWQSNALDVRA